MIASLLRVASVVVISSIRPALADSVKVHGTPWHGAGGEFAIETLGGFAGVSGLASDIPNTGTFETFCLERLTLISTNGTYDYTVGTEAVSGGVGGGSPDPLGYATAYLFTQFRMGTLDGYNYVDPEARAQSAIALQVAIWTLEDEYFGSTPPSNAVAEAWVAEALAAVGSGGPWGATLGLVRVLSLTLQGNERQDVLTIIPLPAAAWMGLVGLAAVPVIRARRRVP